jgi:phosphoglycolate phosphatase-like HAD superfamily hydrolase
MTSIEKQLEQLEHSFLRYTGYFLKDTQNKLELAQALQDTDAAKKEQSKLETMNAIRQIFDVAKQETTLEDVKQKYQDLLETYRQQRQQEIDVARAKGDKATLIRAQIQLTVATNPARGFFEASYSQATKALAKVAHE